MHKTSATVPGPFRRSVAPCAWVFSGRQSLFAFPTVPLWPHLPKRQSKRQSEGIEDSFCSEPSAFTSKMVSAGPGMQAPGGRCERRIGLFMRHGPPMVDGTQAGRGCDCDRWAWCWPDSRTRPFWQALFQACFSLSRPPTLLSLSFSLSFCTLGEAHHSQEQVQWTPLWVLHVCFSEIILEFWQHCY